MDANPVQIKGPGPSVKIRMILSLVTVDIHLHGSRRIPRLQKAMRYIRIISGIVLLPVMTGRVYTGHRSIRSYEYPFCPQRRTGS